MQFSFNMLNWLYGKPPIMEVIWCYILVCPVFYLIQISVLTRNSPKAKSRFDLRYRHDLKTSIRTSRCGMLCALCSDCTPWTFDDEVKRLALKTLVAVARLWSYIFLNSKTTLLYCCRKCQVLCARFFSDTTLYILRRLAPGL